MISVCLIKSKKYLNIFSFKVLSKILGVSSSVLKSCCPSDIYLVLHVVFLFLSISKAYSTFLRFSIYFFRVFPAASLPIIDIKEVLIFKEFKLFKTFPAPPIDALVLLILIIGIGASGEILSTEPNTY